MPPAAAHLCAGELWQDDAGEHPEMVGVNPEVAHEHMAGLNFLHSVAQAWDAGKLFHIDLNDQNYARFDQDWRFGAQNLKQTFFLVKFLEEVGYKGMRHFDAHAFRTEDYEGVKDFARGCMRTYLILKEKAEEFRVDVEIQALLIEIHADDGSMDEFKGAYAPEKASALRAYAFDRVALGTAGHEVREAGPVGQRIAAGGALEWSHVLGLISPVTTVSSWRTERSRCG